MRCQWLNLCRYYNEKCVCAFQSLKFRCTVDMYIILAQFYMPGIRLIENSSSFAFFSCFAKDEQIYPIFYLKRPNIAVSLSKTLCIYKQYRYDVYNFKQSNNYYHIHSNDLPGSISLYFFMSHACSENRRKGCFLTCLMSK